jgi:hypothetical protein
MGPRTFKTRAPRLRIMAAPDTARRPARPQRRPAKDLLDAKERAMYVTSPQASPQTAFELRFPSLCSAGRALSFPCDANGTVQLDALSERAMANYLYARALMGRDYGWPSVLVSDLHH